MPQPVFWKFLLLVFLQYLRIFCPLGNKPQGKKRVLYWKVLPRKEFRRIRSISWNTPNLTECPSTNRWDRLLCACRRYQRWPFDPSECGRKLEGIWIVRSIRRLLQHPRWPRSSWRKRIEPSKRKEILLPLFRSSSLDAWFRLWKNVLYIKVNVP